MRETKSECNRFSITSYEIKNSLKNELFKYGKELVKSRKGRTGDNMENPRLQVSVQKRGKERRDLTKIPIQNMFSTFVTLKFIHASTGI